VPQRPPVAPDGHAPSPQVFNAVHPQIKEIDLFAGRKRSVEKRKSSPTRPQPLGSGPLGQWGIGTWDERYKRDLHGRIAAHWRLAPGGPAIAFKRSKDPEYGLTISHCAPACWTLTCNSGKGTPYTRTFRNVFDAFGCGEYFVSIERQERDLPPQVPRSSAVLPIQRCLLKIFGASAPDAGTFAEAQRRIMQHMNEP
jgi:hypothetical protein